MRAVAIRGAGEDDLRWAEHTTGQRLVIGAEVWCENPGCGTSYGIFFDIAESGEIAGSAQAEHIQRLGRAIAAEHVARHCSEHLYDGEGVTEFEWPTARASASGAK